MNRFLPAIAGALVMTGCFGRTPVLIEGAENEDEAVLPPAVDEDEGDDSESQGGNHSGSGSDDAWDEDDFPDGSDRGSDEAFNRNVDILLVVDNSGSMGEEQGLLAAALPSLVEALESPEVDANYRIAVTTTDRGRQLYGACRDSSASKPGNVGSFISSSCLDRLSDFRTSGDNGDDLSYASCRRNCYYETGDLNLLPTTTNADEEFKIRPWIENIDGVSNLGENIGAEEALACIVPTGITGCGFEMQLESQARALEKAYNPERPEFGFIRPDAQLVIIHVSDEVDCSTDDESIFDPDGDRVFWAPSGELSSYICWAAGVDCDGDGQCRTQNHDKTGAPAAEDYNSVLYPLSRYENQLQKILDAKTTLAPNNKVIVNLYWRRSR